MKRPLMSFLGALALIAAGYVAWNWYRVGAQPAPIEDDRENLRRIIAKQETDSAQALADYRPKAQQQITDIGVDAEDLLRGLPGVVDVTGVKVEKPTHRIIHFRNLHTIPREALAVDKAAVYGRELTEQEIDTLYEQHLLQVELIQVEQLTILRCLIRRHGLTTMHLEGLTENNAQEFARMAGALKAMEAEEIPPMRERLKEHQRLLGVNPRDKKAKMEVDSLVAILKEHRSQMLKMGAAGRLLIAGDLKSVLPLEDAAALKQADPVKDGEVKPDVTKAGARNDAQVRVLLKAGPVTVIELGGSHDLSAAVKRVADGKCQYLRVTTRRTKQLLD